VSGLHTKHPYGDLESLRISVFDLQHQRLVLALEYPRLRTSAERGPLRIKMKTDYNQTSQSSRGIFHTSSADRLVAVSIEDAINGSHLAYVHAIPNSYLLDLVIKHQTSLSVHSRVGTLHILSFDSWASSSTRLLEVSARRGFYFSVQGMRLAIPHYTRRPRRLQVAVYDFYQPVVRMVHGMRNSSYEEYPNNFDGEDKELTPSVKSSIVGSGEEPLLIRVRAREAAQYGGADIRKNTFETHLPYARQIHDLPARGLHFHDTELHLGENLLVYLRVTFLNDC
jgi:hypothetical protein